MLPAACVSPCLGLRAGRHRRWSVCLVPRDDMRLLLFSSFCTGSLKVSDIVRRALSMSLPPATLGRLAASQSQKKKSCRGCNNATTDLNARLAASACEKQPPAVRAVDPLQRATDPRYHRAESFRPPVRRDPVTCLEQSERLCRGPCRLVRSLQPNSQHHVTKAGEGFSEQEHLMCL